VERAVRVPIEADLLAPVVADAVRTAVAAATGPVRSVAVSVAGPVDSATGRLVALPDSPFVLGELAPRELLAPMLDVVPQVDNDVNWAALAEHHTGGAQDLEEFLFVYLGPGIGAAAVSAGTVRHGASGLAGELAHVLTIGPEGRGDRLIACLRAWGLLVPGSPAIAVDRVVGLLRAGPSDQQMQLARSVAGALASATALLNPGAIVMGGPWGVVPGFVEAVATELTRLAAVPCSLRTSTLGDAAPLAGARIAAVRSMQDGLGLGPGQKSGPADDVG
jgi:predicted NBD/HSP70 family sugar kinase